MSFVALKDEGRFATEIRKTGALVETIGLTDRWRMVKRLTHFFKEQRFDIVHTHNIYPHLYGTLAAKCARVPFVVNTRHGQRSGHGWKSRLLFRLAANWVDRIVAVSDDASALCTNEDKIVAAKVQRIWNGIDTLDFAFQGPVLEPIAVCVARLAAEKDLGTLIQGVSLALPLVPNLRLRIIGDGELRSQLESLVSKLGIGQQIEFLGERENVPELLGSCGFFVSSSLSEGISLTLLEAMAIGLPVIATRVGGNPEVVVESETGMLVPAANPKSLADAIVSMCGHVQDWNRMGAAGRERVKQFFDVRTMSDNYLTLYRDLMKKSSR